MSVPYRVPVSGPPPGPTSFTMSMFVQMYIHGPYVEHRSRRPGRWLWFLLNFWPWDWGMALRLHTISFGSIPAPGQPQAIADRISAAGQGLPVLGVRTRRCYLILTGILGLSGRVDLPTTGAVMIGHKTCLSLALQYAIPPTLFGRGGRLGGGRSGRMYNGIRSAEYWTYVHCSSVGRSQLDVFLGDQRPPRPRGR